MKRLNKNIFYLIAFGLLLTLSCDKKTSVTEYEPELLKGFVFLESIPGGATIYVNGTNTGQKTPDSIKWLEYGTNKFILRMKGYRDSTFILNIAENKKEFLNIDFTKNPAMRGSVSLSTVPAGATIIYNDSLLGNVTPYTIKNLLPGLHKFYLQNKNCRFDSVTAEVTSSKTTAINKELVDTTLWVTYNSIYSDIPNVFLTCIGIDKSNNDKWIGTEARGIFIYNEKEWKVLDGSNSPLPGDNINCIFIDEDNSKWIGTYTGGIAKFDGSTWQIYNRSNTDLPSNNISSIRKSPENEIWVTMPGYGIAKFNGSNWINYSSANTAIQTDYVNDIAFDDRKNIYLATDDFGVIKYDGKTFDMLAGGTVKFLIMKGDILYAGFYGSAFAKWSGVKRRMKENWFDPEPVVCNTILTLAFDKYDNLFVGSYEEGMAIINPGFVNVGYYNIKNSPFDVDWITGIGFDNRNVKWITTHGGGLVKYKSTE
jgi:hypothetical protein